MLQQYLLKTPVLELDIPGGNPYSHTSDNKSIKPRESNKNGRELFKSSGEMSTTDIIC